MFSRGQISEGGPYFLGKFPRKFGPGGQISWDTGTDMPVSFFQSQLNLLDSIEITLDRLSSQWIYIYRGTSSVLFAFALFDVAQLQVACVAAGLLKPGIDGLYRVSKGRLRRRLNFRWSD